MWQQPEPALLPRARLARHESVGVVRSALYESLVWVGGLCGSLWYARVACYASGVYTRNVTRKANGDATHGGAWRVLPGCIW